MILRRFRFVGMILIVVVMLGGIYYSTRLTQINTEPRVKAAGSVAPITGTFFLRSSAFFDNEKVLESYIVEMKEMGIDTIQVNMGMTVKNSAGFVDSDELSPGMATPLLLKLAKKYNMRLYFAVSTTGSLNINVWEGNINDPSSDPGHMINYSLILINRLQQLVTSLNIGWDDPIIAGFYIHSETDIYGFLPESGASSIPFYKAISKRIKMAYPSKKIMISPWMMDWQSEEHAKVAFNHLFDQTDIDIVAPQDSVGAELTKVENSERHFKGLNLAVLAHPGREGWANVESYSRNGSGQIIPASIDELKLRLAAAKPWVTKIISWSYQVSMLNSSVFDNYIYDASNANRRAELKKAYMNTYGILGNVSNPVPTVATLPTVGVPTSLFSDISITHFAYSQINMVNTKGIMTGCGSGRFCPESSLSRAEAAVILLRGIHGGSYSPPVTSLNNFTDVPAGHWARNWIYQAVAEGIFSGGTVFNPDSPLTREQAAIVFLRSKYGTAYSPPAASGMFSDIPTSYWAATWIDQFGRAGFTTGCGGGKYCPGDPLSRAQAAVFMVNVFGLSMPVPTLVPTLVPTRIPTLVPTAIPTRVINIPTQPMVTATKKPTATVTRKPTSPVISGGRTLGDSNDDGVIDVVDYSICYQEMNSQKTGGNLRCDFTGSLGKPDGITDTYDYSLWYQKFYESN